METRADSKNKLDGWIPDGKPASFKGWMNGPSRGIQLVLGFSGDSFTYEKIASAFGISFITQGEENSTNLVDGAVDVGWWPLELTELHRVSFVERVIGYKINTLFLGGCAFDNKELFPKIKTIVLDALTKSRPCLIRTPSSWYIITKNEDEKFFGMCPNEKAGNEKIYEVEDFESAYAVISLGEKINSIPDSIEDIEILEYAVSLHEDDVFCHNPEIYPTWRSGKITYHSWRKIIEDTKNPGHDYWHKNVLYHLYWNRFTAIKYLNSLKSKHNDKTTNLIDQAIKTFEIVLETIKSIEITNQVLKSNIEAAKLSKTIEIIEEHETSAFSTIKQIIRHLKGTPN